MTNARFWTYLNRDQVKLTLRPGDTFEHYEGGSTEEGYSRTWQQWEFDGETVTNTVTTEARDCDGRFDTHNEYECAVADLMQGNEVDDITYPKWTRAGYPRSHQRDYSAEAMGY